MKILFYFIFIFGLSAVGKSEDCPLKKSQVSKGLGELLNNFKENLPKCALGDENDSSNLPQAIEALTKQLNEREAEDATAAGVDPNDFKNPDCNTIDDYYNSYLSNYINELLESDFTGAFRGRSNQRDKDVIDICSLCLAKDGRSAIAGEKIKRNSINGAIVKVIKSMEVVKEEVEGKIVKTEKEVVEEKEIESCSSSQLKEIDEDKRNTCIANEILTNKTFNIEVINCAAIRKSAKSQAESQDAKDEAALEATSEEATTETRTGALNNSIKILTKAMNSTFQGCPPGQIAFSVAKDGLSIANDLIFSAVKDAPLGVLVAGLGELITTIFKEIGSDINWSTEDIISADSNYDNIACHYYLMEKNRCEYEKNRKLLNEPSGVSSSIDIVAENECNSYYRLIEDPILLNYIQTALDFKGNFDKQFVDYNNLDNIRISDLAKNLNLMLGQSINKPDGTDQVVSVEDFLTGIGGNLEGSANIDTQDMGTKVINKVSAIRELGVLSPIVNKLRKGTDLIDGETASISFCNNKENEDKTKKQCLRDKMNALIEDNDLKNPLDYSGIFKAYLAGGPTGEMEAANIWTLADEMHQLNIAERASIRSNLEGRSVEDFDLSDWSRSMSFLVRDTGIFTKEVFNRLNSSYFQSFKNRKHPSGSAFTSTGALSGHLRESKQVREVNFNFIEKIAANCALTAGLHTYRGQTSRSDAFNRHPQTGLGSRFHQFKEICEKFSCHIPIPDKSHFQSQADVEEYQCNQLNENRYEDQIEKIKNDYINKGTICGKIPSNIDV